MVRRSAKMLLALMFLSAAGCSAINDYCLKTETGLRNSILAQKAWGEWSWCYEELDRPWDFALGFKAGYRDILGGGNGCQPTLPPREYWKPAYETPAGRQRINAWFDGFSHGALAAQQDGMSGMGELPISPTARHNLMSARSTVNPDCFDSESSGSAGGESVLPAPDAGMSLGGVETPDSVEIPTIPDFPPPRPVDASRADSYDRN